MVVLSVTSRPRTTSQTNATVAVSRARHSGQLVPLSAVTTTLAGTQPLTVNHSGQVPAVTVSFDLPPGKTLSDAVTAGHLPKLAVEKLDGEAVIGSGHEEALIGAGFSRGPRKLTAAPA